MTTTRTLRWDAPASAGGSAITSYAITLSGTHDAIVNPNGAARSYQFTGLADSASFTGTIAAVNATGTGPTAAFGFTTGPASGGMLIGADVNVRPGSTTREATVAAFGTWQPLIGPLRMRRSFNSGMPASWAASAAGGDAAAGLISFHSAKWPGGHAEVASGLADAAITAWVTAAPAGSHITMWHEPENDMTGAQFVAMFRRFYTTAKAANPNIFIGPAHMTYWWDPARLASKGGSGAWWVGADKCDFVAADNYSRSPLRLDQDGEFGSWYSWASGKGKRLGLAEYGQYAVDAATAPDPAKQALRAQIIPLDSTYVTGKLDFWLLWNGIDVASGRDWSLQDTASRDAWKAVAAAGRTTPT